MTLDDLQAGQKVMVRIQDLPDFEATFMNWDEDGQIAWVIADSSFEPVLRESIISFQAHFKVDLNPAIMLN